MNIQFSYLYRDGANYKNYDSVIFSNRNNIPLEEIAVVIQKALIDGVWFYAKRWELKELYLFPYDSELDHEWHEFEDVTETEDGAMQGDIKNFLELIGF